MAEIVKIDAGKSADISEIRVENGKINTVKGADISAHTNVQAKKFEAIIENQFAGQTSQINAKIRSSANCLIGLTSSVKDEVKTLMNEHIPSVQKSLLSSQCTQAESIKKSVSCSTVTVKAYLLKSSSSAMLSQT